MSPLINKREDEWIIENRVRFAVEIIRKISEKTGEGFIIGYIMGDYDTTSEEGIAIAKTHCRLW